MDHIGVAVDDLDAAIELYKERFEMGEQHREVVGAPEGEGRERHADALRTVAARGPRVNHGETP